MRKPVKNFRISAQGALQVRKQLKWILWGGVCDKATAHIIGQWESFRRIVNILRMCFLWVSFSGSVRFRCYKPTNTTNFGDRRTNLLHSSTALARWQNAPSSLRAYIAV